MASLPRSQAIQALFALVIVGLAAFGLDLFVVPSLLAFIEPLRDLTPRLVVRVHLLLFLSFLLLTASFLWFRTDLRDTRRKLFLANALVAFTIAASILIFSQVDFLSEESPITLFTTLILFLAGIVAFATFLRYTLSPNPKPLLLRILWFLLASAFLFASLDETLRIHERIGQFLESAVTFDQVGPFQVDDITTLAYAFGGLAFVALFLATSCKEYIRKNRVFYPLFIAAILVYGISTLLDALEVSAVPAGASIDFIRLANSIEECFEFFAANLFLLAFLTEALEAEEGRLLNSLGGAFDLTWTRRPAFRRIVTATAALYIVALLTIRIVLPPSEDRYILETDRFEIDQFADYRQDLSGVDGITCYKGSIYAANESGQCVVRIDSNGRHEILAGPADGLVSPESVAVHGDHVYFSDDHLGSVFRLTGGKLTRILGPADGLRSPEGLAIDSRGILYIADEGTGSVYKYESGALSIYASALHGLEGPEEIAFDRFDNLYITDDIRGTITVIDSEGRAARFAESCEELRKPEAIHIAGDTVYVSDTEAGAVFRFNLAGEGGPLLSFTSRHKEIQGVATDAEGRLYVALSNDPPMPSRILRIAAPTALAQSRP